MNTTFALVAFLTLNPNEPMRVDTFVIDSNMSQQDCDAAVKLPQIVILQSGVKLSITDTSVLACEAE